MDFWDGLLSRIFYLLRSCQYAKVQKTAFDLLLHSIQPVSEQKGHVCVIDSVNVYGPFSVQ